MLEALSSHLTLENLMAIAYLVVLEGVLSVDNALALAALVRKRLSNPVDQRRALRWGILGAYVFRTGIIFAGVWLMSQTWVKAIAAAYLIYLGTSELLPKKKAESEEHGGFSLRMLSPLWATIISVELMDLMFSADSIAVTLSISDQAWILMSGAFLGILAMRFAAQLFIGLIERFPVLEKTGFVLVILAGVKLALGLGHIVISERLFFLAMFGVVFGSLVGSNLMITMQRVRRD